MLDLQKAKRLLKERGLTLVIVKDGKVIFETEKSGIQGFLEAIEKFNEILAGSSVADKIIGRAAALLCAYSKVMEAFASVLSFDGKKILEENKIYYEFEDLVPRILDKDRRESCPFERFSKSINNPREAYTKLKKLAEKLAKQEKFNNRVF